MVKAVQGGQYAGATETAGISGVTGENNLLGRRSFLALSGAVVVGGAAVAAKLIADDSKPANSQGNSLTAHLDTDDGRVIALAALLQDPAAAVRIGNVYRADDPKAPHLDILAMFDKFGATRENAGGLDRHDMSKDVSASARGDWMRSDLVVVNGWLLPRTYADLCATASREFGS